MPILQEQISAPAGDGFEIPHPNPSIGAGVLANASIKSLFAAFYAGFSDISRILNCWSRMFRLGFQGFPVADKKIGYFVRLFQRIPVAQADKLVTEVLLEQ